MMNQSSIYFGILLTAWTAWTRHRRDLIWTRTSGKVASWQNLNKKQFEHLSIACSAFREAPSGWIGNKDTFKSVSSFRRKLAALSLSPNRSPKVYSFCQWLDTMAVGNAACTTSKKSRSWMHFLCEIKVRPAHFCVCQRHERIRHPHRAGWNCLFSCTILDGFSP